MEKHVLAVCALLVFFSSCSNPDLYLMVWNGNNAFTRGDYQTANTQYLRAGEKGGFRDYISYNLGNVYYALGESAAAKEEWKSAVFTADKELLFRTLFNQGVLEFESGEYNAAFTSFRDALELKPGNIPAKINLEYSLRRMNANPSPAEAGQAGAVKSEKNGTSDEIRRILEFLKRKDNSVWKAPEEAVPSGEVNDW